MAIFLVAAVGTALATAGQIASQAARRDREVQLLWIGHQFQQAIGLYYQRSPGAAKQFPQKLEDLLDDKRYLTAQHYLRKIYPDPMTGKSDWNLVMAPEGGIKGVSSRSTGVPLRQLSGANAKPAQRYSVWEFVYEPPDLKVSSAAVPPPPK